MEFTIIFYKDVQGHSPIEEFILDLATSNRVLAAKTQSGVEKLRSRAYHKEPLSKYIEPQIWELRIQAGSDTLRIFYTFTKGRVIILLHVFIKKQQKTPAGELVLARKRLQELQQREAEAN